MTESNFPFFRDAKRISIGKLSAPSMSEQVAMPNPHKSVPAKVAARSLFAHALARLEAHHLLVQLNPDDGTWRYEIDGRHMKEGEIVALAARIEPLEAELCPPTGNSGRKGRGKRLRRPARTTSQTAPRT